MIWFAKNMYKRHAKYIHKYHLKNIYYVAWNDMYCRVMVFGPSPLQWICREWGQKLGSDEATACFGDERYTESGGLTSQGEGTPRSRMGMRQPLSITQEPPSCFWASPLIWVVFVVIYSSLPFILLLHLSVIHAYP